MAECQVCGKATSFWNMAIGTRVCADCYHEKKDGNSNKKIAHTIVADSGLRTTQVTNQADSSPRDESGRYTVPVNVNLPSLSGWVATLLGLYLVGTGIFNIIKLTEAGGRASEQSNQIVKQTGVDPNTYPVVIIVSYIVGAPIFLGSTLLALGSIARSSKRSSPQSQFF